MDPEQLLAECNAPGYSRGRSGSSVSAAASGAPLFEPAESSVDAKSVGGSEKKARVAKAPRSRNWCFTDFGDVLPLDRFVPVHVRDYVRYIKRQRERCPDSGREHYQGWCQLTEHQTLAWMKKNISATAHWEACKGSEAANDAYCSKLKSQIGEPESMGSYKTQGSGCCSMEELAELVLDGRPLVEIGRLAPAMMLGHTQKVLQYRNLMNPPKPRKFTKILCLYGEPGSDKGGYARRLYPNAFIMHDNYHGWMDGYDGEAEIIINEFTCLFPLPEFLQLCDCDPIRLPIKGSYTTICATTVVLIGYKLHPMLYYGSDPAWIKRMNKYGTIIAMKANKTGWREVEELDYDVSMEPRALGAAAEVTNFLSRGPDPAVLPKEVRGPGNNQTCGQEYVHRSPQDVDLNIDSKRRRQAADDLKLPMSPPPLVRQSRYTGMTMGELASSAPVPIPKVGRRVFTVGDVLAQYAKMPVFEEEKLDTDDDENGATISCSEEETEDEDANSDFDM